MGANNLAGISDNYTVTVLDTVEPFGLFAKTIGNQTSLLEQYSYNQSFNYFLQAHNIGLTRLEDVVIMDKLPDGIVLDAPISLP